MSLDGTWALVSAELGGQAFDPEDLKGLSLTIEGDSYIAITGPEPDKGTLVTDPSKNPATIDIIGSEGPNAGRTIRAIFEQHKDSLTICYQLGAAGRPSQFRTLPSTMLFLVRYRRQS